MVEVLFQSNPTWRTVTKLKFYTTIVSQSAQRPPPKVYQRLGSRLNLTYSIGHSPILPLTFTGYEKVKFALIFHSNCLTVTLVSEWSNINISEIYSNVGSADDASSSLASTSSEKLAKFGPHGATTFSAKTG